jgi:prophage antirepressor-like protein
MATTITITHDFTSLIEYFVSKDIRITGSVNNPLFCLIDVAKHIDDVNYNRTCEKYDESLKKNIDYNTGKKIQNMGFLTEYGLYEYLLTSPRPKAKEFRRMVFEILKQIRKKVVDSVKLQYKLLLSRMIDIDNHMRDVMALEKLTDTDEYKNYLISLWFISNASSNKNVDFKYDDIQEITHMALHQCAVEAMQGGSLLDDKQYISEILEEALIKFRNKDEQLSLMRCHKYYISEYKKSRRY